MDFRTILVIVSLLIQSILAVVGSRNTHPLQGVDRSRSFSSGGDASSSRQRLASSGGEATPLRQRPPTPARDATSPRQRLTSLGGDTTPLRQRPSTPARDASPQRQRELPSEVEGVLRDLGSMRKEVQSLQQETLSMFKDLYKSSMLPDEEPAEDKMDAAAKERLQVLLRDGGRKLGASADDFIKLVDKASKAIIDNAGDPEIIPRAQKKAAFLLDRKNQVLKLNAHYMTLIESNLKGMLNTMDDFEMSPPVRPIPARSSSRSAPVPRGDKGATPSARGERRATPAKQPEIATPSRSGIPRRKNSLRETN